MNYFLRELCLEPEDSAQVCSKFPEGSRTCLSVCGDLWGWREHRWDSLASAWDSGLVLAQISKRSLQNMNLPKLPMNQMFVKLFAEWNSERSHTDRPCADDVSIPEDSSGNDFAAGSHHWRTGNRRLGYSGCVFAWCKRWFCLWFYQQGSGNYGPGSPSPGAPAAVLPPTRAAQHPHRHRLLGSLRLGRGRYIRPDLCMSSYTG